MRTITSGPITAVGIRPDACTPGRFWARSTDRNGLCIWSYGSSEKEARSNVAHMLLKEELQGSFPSDALLDRVGILPRPRSMA